MFRDGYGCKGTDKIMLVVYPDKTVTVMCEKCIQLNDDCWEPGTLFFQIGDDVTNYFL